MMSGWEVMLFLVHDSLVCGLIRRLGYPADIWSYLADPVAVGDVLGLVGNVARRSSECWHWWGIVRAIS